LGQNKYVISVGAGKNQVPLIRRLVERGYLVIAFDKDENAPGKQLCYMFKNISTWDYIAAISWLESLKLKFEGALSFSYGKALVTQQKIIDYFNLKCKLGDHFINIMADKSHQRRVLKKHGLSTLMEYNSYRDIKKDFEEKSFVLKDNMGGSSSNILLLHNNQYDKDIFDKITKRDYIIQEFLDGKEYRVVGLIKDKKIMFYSVMERTSMKGTFFTGRLRPEKNHKKRIFSLFEDVIDKLNIVDSGIKIDLIIEEDRTEILEIDFGIPGDYFDVVLSKDSYNYNYMDNYINLLLGLPVENKISLDNELFFDYVYNNEDEVLAVDYDKIFYTANKCFDNPKIIQIKEQGQIVSYPQSNMDAIFAIVHNNMTLSNNDVNRIFNDALHNGVK